MTKLRLGETLKIDEPVRKLWREDQRNSGGYGKDEAPNADLESSYRVMRGLMMVKEVPADAEGLRSFVAKCRNDDGGYGPAPGETSTVSGTYYATIIRKWLD